MRRRVQGFATVFAFKQMTSASETFARRALAPAVRCGHLGKCLNSND
jgi:hypothetical protein